MLKNLFKLVLTCAVMLACAGQLTAAPLTADEALRRARSNGGEMMRAAAGAQFELAHTETVSPTGAAAVYIFSRGEDAGFIVTPADDRFQAVLGYAESGEFDFETAPPAFKWWIGEYAREISWYMERGEDSPRRDEGMEAETVSSTKLPAKASRQNVAMIIQTKWNQGAPYNNLCPLSGGYRCYTGCVATAMAQVINYHKYPAHGNGSHSYTYDGMSMSFDFGNTNFDWGNMINDYYYGGTSAQNNAVATLMYACGVSVDMMYGTGGSGAFGSYVPYALMHYFNYDESVQYHERDWFTASEWDEIIYTEMAAKRPVIFGGQANDGGHEFVCDGYQVSDGKYHFNWGWGGAYDGWFDLSSLNPEGQGIGGFEGGYNRDQHAICNIKPNAGGAASSYPLFTEGGLEATNTTLGSYTTISFGDNGGIYSYYRESISVDFTLKVTSKSNNAVTYGPTNKIDFPESNEGQNWGFSKFGLQVPGSLSPGEYTAELCYKAPNGSYADVCFDAATNAYLNMVVGADNSVTFTKGKPKESYSVEVNELYAMSDVHSGEECKLFMKITNGGSVTFPGPLYFKGYNGGTETLVWSASVGISMDANTTKTYTLTATFNLPDGLYDLKCFDEFGELLGGPFPLTIGDVPVMPESVTLSETSKTLTEGEEFTLTATVAPDNATDKTVSWTTSNASVATVTSAGLVKAVAAGSATITATTANGLTATCAVTVNAAVIAATGVTLSETSKTLTEGEEFTLTATVAPDNATDKTVTWTTSDASVATVTSAGLVKAVAAGSATITATTANGLTATCAVTVNAAEVRATSITLDRTSITGYPGDVVTLVATVLPEDATNKTVAWESSDAAVATVDQTGKVTIVSPGNCTVTGKTTDGSELQAQCAVECLNSGIEAIIGVRVQKADVYTAGGVLVKRGADSAFVSALAPGFYIICVEGKSYKVVKN